MWLSKKQSFSNQSLLPSQLCILAGAGISLPPPSSFPIAAPVLQHILRDLARGYAATDAYLSTLDVPPVKPHMKWEYLRFEFIMDRLASYDPKESFLRALYSRPDARPNSYHIWLAKMLSLGANVITTNFDLMIENALESLEIPQAVRPVVLNTDDECDQYNRSTDADPPAGPGVLQKLHGSVNNAMAARFPQLVGSRGEGPRYETAGTLMFKRTLLVLGYSGGDDFDVMPMLGYMYDNNAQTIIWIEHAASATPQRISDAVPPRPIIEPAYSHGYSGHFDRIQGDSATVVNLLCHESCPRLERSAAISASPLLPSLDLTDWERLSLLRKLMKGSLYAEQAGIGSAVESLLPKAAAADEQSRCAAVIHNAVDALFVNEDDKGPPASEITSAIGNAALSLRQRLTSKVLLLESWLAHQRGADDERDVKLRALMAWCEENANWEIMCSAPGWAFRYCEDLLADDRRSLYLKVGWDLMVWTQDLNVTIGMLYVVEDAQALLNDGVEMPFSYWDYQKSLKSAIFYNERLGNVKEARNAAAHLQRVEWVWNQFDAHKRYGETVEQLEQILSRRVRQRSF